MQGQCGARFLALSPEQPPGFESGKLDKRCLLASPIAIYASSRDALPALVDDLRDRICGLLVLPGERLEQSKIGKSLYELSIPKAQLSDLRSISGLLLEHIAQEKRLEVANETQNIELERAKQIQLETRATYHGSLERLGERVDEVHRLIRHSLVGIFRSTPDEGVILANPAALEILGFEDQEEVYGFDIREIYLDPNAREELFSRARKGVVESFETRIRRQSGEILDVEMSAFPVFGEGGELLYIEGSAIDITARKEAARRAKEEHEELRERYRMFSAGPVIVFKWQNTENWPAEYVSRNVKEVLGYTPEEFESGAVTYASLIHADDLEQVAGELALHSELSSSFEHAPYRLRRKDGSTIWVLDYTTVIRNERGEATQFLGYIVDITQRTLAEEAKIELERQIQHAQKLESLGVLAGGIAHDFNNLLVAIVGNAELLREELPKASPLAKRVLGIERAADRAADLARQMLAYSGKGTLSIEYLDLVELLREMGALLEVSISKKVRIHYAFEEAGAMTKGDATQLRQVVMNLITNASEAMGEAGGEIFVAAGTRDCSQEFLSSLLHRVPQKKRSALTAGSYAWLEVRDTGCGMSAATLERLFDPFFSTKFAGRGLGMAAVLGIIAGHGGTIRVDSEEGKGSSFLVLLPTAKGNAPPALPTATEPGSRALTPGLALLVDDEASVRLIGREMLQHLGFSVIEASRGEEALAIAKEKLGSLDCVLLDLTMPGIGGAQTFKKLRELSPKIPIVICSGYSEQHALESFQGCELAGFLHKPFRLHALRERLASMGVRAPEID